MALPPAPLAQSFWRNVGRRLGVLEAPGAEAEPKGHLEPAATFGVTRVAIAGGRRYLQLNDGRGWVPERSRKKEDRVVVELIDGSSSPDLEDGGASPRLPAPVPKTGELLRHICVVVTATRTANTASTQIGQVSLRAGGKVLDLSGFTVANPGGQSPQTEQPCKLLAPKGKWLDFNFRESGQSVLLISSPTECQIDDLAFRTASDAPCRDPAGFRVYGSLDGWSWVPLLAVDTDLYMPKSRMAWTPWFQLRSDVSAAVEVSDGGDQPTSCSLHSHPAAMSWWRSGSEGARPPVLRQPRYEDRRLKRMAAGSCFAVVRVKSVAGRRYLQLPEDQGWVPECYRDGAIRAVAEPLHGRPELSMLPAAVSVQSSLKRKRDDSDLDGESIRSCIALPASSVRLKHLRLIILAARGSKVVSVQISQVSLRYRGALVSLDGFDATSPHGQSPANEGAKRILAEGGKWLDMNFSTNKRSVVVITAPEGMPVDDIAFCTAGDIPGRDPVCLRIDGSLDGEEWAVLHETGEMFPTPVERRVWSPWLALEVQRPAPKVLDTPSRDKVRHRCSVPACMDSYATTEGYLVRGKLLTHMLRKHPGAPETELLQEEIKLFAVADPTSEDEHMRCEDDAMSDGEDEAGPASDSDDAPATPPKPAPADASVETPSPLVQAWKEGGGAPVDVRLGLDKSGCAVMVLRLSALAGASVSGLVDIEAEVQRVDKVQHTTLRRHPGQQVKVRRFMLRDEHTTCLWAVFGEEADRYDETLNGRRIIVRSTRVQEVRSARHLLGCARVDFC